MDHEKQEKIALFRFGIIFPLLDERLEYGEKSRIIAEICEQTHEIPYSDRTTLSSGSIYNWLKLYNRKQRIEDLYPVERKDKGQLRKLSSESELALRHYRDEHPETKLTTLVRMAVNDGILLPSEDPSMSVIYRMFKDYDRQKQARNTKDMRRFSMDQCNDCWMTICRNPELFRPLTERLN